MNYVISGPDVRELWQCPLDALRRMRQLADLEGNERIRYQLHRISDGALLGERVPWHLKPSWARQAGPVHWECMQTKASRAAGRRNRRAVAA